MSKQEIDTIDVFFENEEAPTIYPEDSQLQSHPVTSSYEDIQKKNRIVIALLSAILIVGITIVVLQVFQPFHNNYDDGTYFYSPENSSEGPQFYQNEGDGSSGMIMNRRSIDGKMEYSTDGGKTWIEGTPEEGSVH